MSSLFDLTIPEYDATMIRRSASLPLGSAIPAELEESYWELKRCHDRIGTRLNLNAIAILCHSLGYGKASRQEAKGPSVASLYREKKIKINTPLVATWRGKEVSGALKGVTGRNEVRVLLDGDSEARSIPEDKVRVAEMATP